MAVAAVGTNTAANSDTANQSSLTISSHTVPSGTTALVVTVGASDWSAAPTVSSIQWNGSQNFTAVASTRATQTIDDAYAMVQHWILESPTPATGNIVITFSANTYNRWAIAHSYDGSATTSSTEGGNTSTGTSSTSLNLAPTTTTTNGSMLLGAYWYAYNGPENLATVDTELYENGSGTLNGVWGVARDPSTGAGESVGWTMTSGHNYGASVFVLKQAEESSSTHTTTGVLAGGGATTSGTASRNGSTPVPDITSVSSATPVHLGQLTIYGTGFGASQGGSTVTVTGGTAQTVVSWADTAITVTVLRGTNKHGTGVNVTVTTGGGSDNYALTSILPRSGWSYIDLTTPNATASYRITSTADLASGNQLCFESLSGTVEFYADATFRVSDSVTEFDVEVWNADGWGSAATQTMDLVGTFHPATGDLSGIGAILSGVAKRTTTHTSSGVLAGGGASTSGTSGHDAAGTHPATGALAGGGANLSGTAYHAIHHNASGALVGSGALVVGVAAHDIGFIARPAEDISTGSWAPSQSGHTLYDMLDETIPDDSDYISATSGGDPYVGRFEAMPDPNKSTDHVIKYRAWAPAGKGVEITIKCGDTIIKTITHTSLPTTSTEFQYELTEAEADMITDYSNIIVEIDVI